MRITFKTDGGLAFFPGLAKPFDFDSSQLGKKDAQTLQNLVDEAQFFKLPATIGKTAPGAADMQTQTLTIENGEQSNTVKLVSDASPEVQALFDQVQELVSKLRTR